MDKLLFTYFKHIDMFGTHPLFTIRGHQTFQTFIGSIVSLICIIAITYYMCYFLNEIFYHKNPTILTKNYYDQTPKFIKLTKKNFTFALGLQDQDYSEFIDETIYNISAVYTKVTLYTNGTMKNFFSEPIKIIKCNKYEFETIPEKYKTLDLKNLYCLDKNEIEIEGEYKSNIWSYVKINFTKCINSTNNNYQCRTNEEINNLLKGGFLGIFMPDYNILLNSYKNPYNSYIKNIYSTFSSLYFADMFIYLKEVAIDTDSGYFFKNKNTIKFAVYDYSQNEIDFRETDHFLSVTLRVSSKTEVHQRSYIKLQTIFSNVGGMLKMILLFGEYSIVFFKILLYKNYILEFFNLDESFIRIQKIRKEFHLGNKSENLFISNQLDPINSSVQKNLFQNQNLYFNKNNNNIKLKIAETSENKSNSGSEIEEISKNEMINPNNIFKQSITKTLTKIGNYFYLSNSYLNDGSVLGKIPRVTKSLAPKKTFNKSKHHSNKHLRVVKTFNYNSKNFKKTKENILSKISQKNMLPKLKMRTIKVPEFFKDFVCKKNTCYTIKKVHENYKEIQFLLDIVHYLKTENKISIIEKLLFTEGQRKNLSYMYSFESDFEMEKQGYEHMIKHKNNILEEGIEFNLNSIQAKT